MISSTWSQITQPDNKQLSTSPMTAFSKTSSPVNRNSHSNTSSISVSFYKNHVSFTSPSLVGSTNSNSSIDIGKYVMKDKTEASSSFSPKNTSDSGVQVSQNESDDFLVSKYKESNKMQTTNDAPLVNLNDDSLSIIANTSSTEDPSIQHY